MLGSSYRLRMNRQATQTEMNATLKWENAMVSIKWSRKRWTGHSKTLTLLTHTTNSFRHTFLWAANWWKTSKNSQRFMKWNPFRNEAIEHIYCDEVKWMENTFAVISFYFRWAQVAIREHQKNPSIDIFAFRNFPSTEKFESKFIFIWIFWNICVSLNDEKQENQFDIYFVPNSMEISFLLCSVVNEVTIVCFARSVNTDYYLLKVQTLQFWFYRFWNQNDWWFGWLF